MGLTLTVTLSITLTLTLTLTLTHPAPYLQDVSQYNCVWYAQDANCALYGNSCPNVGMPANMACCDCARSQGSLTPAGTGRVGVRTAAAGARGDVAVRARGRFGSCRWVLKTRY